VLVSDDGRVRLIDFRYANFGPVATDFAALEASVRIRGDWGPVTGPALMETAKEERRLLAEAWGDAERQGAVEHPYWAKVSSHLVSLARQASPSLSQREYIATCLLYALRVGRVRRLAEGRKMRLIPWIAALSEALDR
jgi:thiamine kinase-like enzyme